MSWYEFITKEENTLLNRESFMEFLHRRGMDPATTSMNDVFNAICEAINTLEDKK